MSATPSSSNSGLTDSDDAGHPADELIIAKAAAILATTAGVAHAPALERAGGHKKRKRKRAAQLSTGVDVPPLLSGANTSLETAAAPSAGVDPQRSGGEDAEDADSGGAAQRKRERKEQRAQKKSQRASLADGSPAEARKPAQPSDEVDVHAAAAAAAVVDAADPVDVALAELVAAEAAATALRKKAKRAKPVAATLMTAAAAAAVGIAGAHTPAAMGRASKAIGEGVTPAVAKLVTPIGVVVIGDDEESTVEPEMRRLLRIPRYFDDDFEAAAVRCYKCGGSGHMARNCVEEGRARPCYLCAQFGHGTAACPQRLCFRCSRPGHVARDCPNGYSRAAEKQQSVCLRCGSTYCDGVTDSVRAAGGCAGSYSRGDLAHVRCYVCGSKGHLCCARPPDTIYRSACYNCGEGGHTADECRAERPPSMRNERQQRQDYGYGDGGSSYGFGGGSNGHGGGSGGRWNSSANDRWDDGRKRGLDAQYGGGGGGGGGAMAAARQRSYSRYSDAR